MKDLIRLLGKKKKKKQQTNKLLDTGLLSWLDSQEQWEIYKPDHFLELKAVGNDTATQEGQVPKQAWIISRGPVQSDRKSVLKFVSKFCRPVQNTVVRDLVEVPVYLQIHGCQRGDDTGLAQTLGGKKGSIVPGAHCTAPKLPAPNALQQRTTINP